MMIVNKIKLKKKEKNDKKKKNSKKQPIQKQFKIHINNLNSKKTHQLSIKIVRIEKY